MKAFGFCDVKCKDETRMFFGGKSLILFEADNIIDGNSIIEKYYTVETLAPTNKTSKEQKLKETRKSSHKPVSKSKALEIEQKVNVSNTSDGAKLTFINSLSEEDLNILVNEIENPFKNGLEGASKLIEEWKNDPKNKIVDTEAEMTSLKKLQKSIEDTSKKTSVIKSAMEEMSDTGYISADTYSQLVELGGNFTKCLEIQDGRLTLNIEKLKDLEAQQYKNVIAENEETLSTLKLAKSRMLLYGIKNQSDYNMLNEIEDRIKTLEEENGIASTLIDGIYNAGSDDGSGGSSKPDSIVTFENDLAKYEHEINMGRKKEDSEFYDWLDKEAHKAYEGQTEYQADLWKYEEQVYNGRKKLAEEAFDNEHDLFEKRVDDLEQIANKISETSIDTDGTELTTQEKYREIASVYEEIRYAIEDEINRIVQAGVEGHEDLLKELEKQSEEYSDKIADTFKSAVEAEKALLEKAKEAKFSEYDDQIDKVKSQQEAAQKAADAEIEAIQTKIDNLQKVNDEKQREYDIEKAKQDLEKAKNQRTRMVYGADGRKGYEIDNDAVNEAQKNLDDLLLKKQIEGLENQKTLLEDMRDKESKSYDTIIKDIEKQKEDSEKQFDELIKKIDEYNNPTEDISNPDVWEAIAKANGDTYENGKYISKDGSVFDINGIYAEYQKQIEANNEKEKSKGNGKEKDKNARLNESYNNADVNTAQGNTNNADQTNRNGKVISGVEWIEKLLNKMGANQDVVKRIIDNFNNHRLDPSLFNIMFNSTQQHTQDALRQFEGQYKIDPNSYEVANKNTTVAPTFNGDININNPVGNSDDLAKEIIMNLPNAVKQRLYSNIKKY